MEIQRSIEFILENQARFFSGMEELRSLVVRIAQQQLDLTQLVDRFQREVSSAVLAIAQGQKRLAEEQTRLAEEQTRLAKEQTRLAEELTRLAETVRHTDEKLGALITVVDDLVRRPKQ